MQAFMVSGETNTKRQEAERVLNLGNILPEIYEVNVLKIIKGLLDRKKVFLRSFVWGPSGVDVFSLDKLKGRFLVEALYG